MSRVPGGKTPELMVAAPSSVIRLAVLNSTGDAKAARSFGVAKWMSPPQYAGQVVLGVDPPTIRTSLPISLTFQPRGILPAAVGEGSNDFGKRAARSGGSPTSPPSIF